MGVRYEIKSGFLCNWNSEGCVHNSFLFQDGQDSDRTSTDVKRSFIEPNLESFLSTPIGLLCTFNFIPLINRIFIAERMIDFSAQ